jgi:hypothetical protein
MEAIPALLSQGRENVRRAPAAWTQRAIRECEGALAFLTRGIGQLTVQGSKNVPRFEAAAERAATAFGDFRSHLESELLPKAVDRYACGEEALALYLAEGHFLDQGDDGIVAHAESELAEATDRLTELGPAAGDTRSRLAEVHPTADEYYARYQEVWDRVRGMAEKHALLSWPEFPIRYVPRPEWAREAAPYLYFLFYRSPAAFNRPAVHDYLVTPIERSMPPTRQEELLRTNNDSVIKLNHVVHHGGIGHHVQNWHAHRSPSRVGQIAAVDCASRIAMFCGGTMAEGWACYATDLIREFGGLTPLEEVAELWGRVRMCARAVVDVRLHQGRFTLEQAKDFYVEKAGMERGAGASEAVKNSMFPGAAVMYLTGTDGIHGLRKELAEREGAAFDLFRFHDEFLSYGSIPVSLIAAQMKRRRRRGQSGRY